MSRIGKKPISIPAGVTVTVDAHNKVTVENSKGKLEQAVNRLIGITIENGVVTLTPKNTSREANEAHGLYRTLISNMVDGLTHGFTKSLTINGVGYKVATKGNGIQLNIGFSHSVEVQPMEGIKLSCPTPLEIKVEGYNKEVVGQMAANIKAIKPVEPYHAYGIRYTNEVVVKKEGKKAGK